jgi:hypothetical protein
MPLIKSKSKKALSANISELMHSFNKGGEFAKGKRSKKAHQMAVAAAFSMKKKMGGK